MPSTNTRAMPQKVLRWPTHVTEVPVKVNVACAPGILENAVLPPLHGQLESLLHPALKLTDGSVSS